MNDVRRTIGWADYTWNPVTGCTRGCPYCYARRMAYRLRGRFGYPQDEPFRPTFHPDRLSEPYWAPRSSRVFVASMGELFQTDGFAVQKQPALIENTDDVVGSILRTVRACPGHTFMFLTKNSHLLAAWNPWPANAWVGATVIDTDMLLTAQQEFEAVDAPVRCLSVEPMLSRLDQLWTLSTFDWLIIGAQTGPGAEKHRARREWVEELVAAADAHGIPVFEKDSLAPIVGRPLRKEWPSTDV